MYHGCALRNRNGTRKLIDCKTGQNCIHAANNLYWKSSAKKVEYKKPKRTRIFTKKEKEAIDFLCETQR